MTEKYQKKVKKKNILKRLNLSTSKYVALIVIFSIILVGIWIYQRYIYEKEPGFLSYTVETEDINEIIKVRGEVVAQKEFDLEFPFSGIVEKIYVEEGQNVEAGARLIKLETTDYSLKINKLAAYRNRQAANLNKLLAGATQEDVKIYETAVNNAKLSVTDRRTTENKAEVLLDNAKQNLEDVKAQENNDLSDVYNDVTDTVNDAYLQADDAINKQVDAIFDDDDSTNPELSFTTTDSKKESYAERGRRDAGNELKEFKNELRNLDSTREEILEKALADAKSHLLEIRGFLSKTMDATNKAGSISAATLNTYKTNISTARGNINAAITDINTIQQNIITAKLNNQVSVNMAQAKVDSAKAQLNIASKDVTIAQGALQTALDKLNSIKAGTRPEDISYARAQVQEVNSDIALVQEEINKSTLYAPNKAKVTKIWVEEGELFKPNQIISTEVASDIVSAVSLSTIGFKLQADVSELDIGKVEEGNGHRVIAKLDAFPDKEFEGKIISIEPQEIIKDDDRYFRINVSLNEPGKNIRSGMSADLYIYTSSRENAVRIPEYMIIERDEKQFVNIQEREGFIKEVEIKTGISDGEFIEVTEGLSKGQILIIFAE